MHASDSGTGTPDGAVGGMPMADLSRVLVVGRSPINRVVVAKIVEQCGLKPVSEALETSARALHSLLPGIVVLDGGPDNADCDALLPDIVSVRRLTGGPMPCVILLSTRNGMPEDAALSGVVDAVVAKPITPERLQPLIGRLVRRGHQRT